MRDKQISVWLRLGSMLLDHFILCFTLVPPLIFLDAIFGTNDRFETHPMDTVGFFFIMFIYLNKDFLNGRSIAKRILGFKIVDRATGESANVFKCFLRNMTIPIWPLEVVVSLLSKRRRLGDIIANTKIEVADKTRLESILDELQRDLKNIRLTTSILLTLVVGAAYITGLWYLMDKVLKF